MTEGEGREGEGRGHWKEHAVGASSRTCGVASNAPAFCSCLYYSPHAPYLVYARLEAPLAMLVGNSEPRTLAIARCHAFLRLRKVSTHPFSLPTSCMHKCTPHQLSPMRSLAVSIVSLMN